MPGDITNVYANLQKFTAAYLYTVSAGHAQSNFETAGRERFECFARFDVWHERAQMPRNSTFAFLPVLVVDNCRTKSFVCANLHAFKEAPECIFSVSAVPCMCVYTLSPVQGHGIAINILIKFGIESRKLRVAAARNAKLLFSFTSREQERPKYWSHIILNKSYTTTWCVCNLSMRYYYFFQF
jgi:hypothetical protein